MLLLTVASSASTHADTIINIYRSALTDFARAKHLIGQLRNETTFSEHDLNLIEGDIHFNRGDYFQAINFYKRAIYDPALEDSIAFRETLLVRIIPCYLTFSDAHNMKHFCDELSDLASRTRNTAHQAFALFYLGRMYHLSEDKQQGYRQMKDAIKLLENSKVDNRKALLYRYRMLLVEYLQTDNRNAEALQWLNQVIAAYTPDGQQPTGQGLQMTPQMQKDIYAHLATLNFKMGNTEEAAAWYQRFKTTGNDYQYDYKCVEPYLADNGLYDDMVAFAISRKKYLEKISVNRNLEYTFTLRMLADGYMGKKMYREAARLYSDMSTMKREIIGQVEKYSLSELTSVYDTKERELKYKTQIANERLLGVILLALIIVTWLVHMGVKANKNARKLQEKNRAMAKILDESMRNKQLLTQKQTAHNNDNTKDNEDADDEGKAMFDKIVRVLADEKLHLQPDLSRETLMKRFRIPKNKFSSLFTRHAGMTYSQYINTIRLEHAVEMLRLHPNYTIESVAEECGMGATSLYRLFSQKYGMSPAEYREAEQENSKEHTEEEDE